jgi:OTU-like cysteine protease
MPTQDLATSRQLVLYSSSSVSSIMDWRRRNLRVATVLVLLFGVVGCSAITDASSSTIASTASKSSIPRSAERPSSANGEHSLRFPPWNPSPQIDANGFLIPKYRRIPGEWERESWRRRRKQTQHVLSTSPPAIIRQVPGDGNCLFHSISTCYAYAVNGTHIDLRNANTMQWLYHHSRKLRQLAVDCLEGKLHHSNNSRLLFLQGHEYLKCHELVDAAASQYGISGQEYCELMRQDSYWGGGPEIVALCNVLQRPIHVYELYVPKEKKKVQPSKYLFGRKQLKSETTSSGGSISAHSRSDDNKESTTASPDFVLRRMACFGSPKFDKNSPLHILSADSRFPDILPGKQLPSGNHFLAIFPNEIAESKTNSKQWIRGGRIFDEEEDEEDDDKKENMGWWGRLWSVW